MFWVFGFWSTAFGKHFSKQSMGKLWVLGSSSLAGEGCECINWWILPPLKVSLIRASKVAIFFTTYVFKYFPKPKVPSPGVPKWTNLLPLLSIFWEHFSSCVPFPLFPSNLQKRDVLLAFCLRLRKKSDERAMTFIYSGTSCGRFPSFLTGKWEAWRIP